MSGSISGLGEGEETDRQTGASIPGRPSKAVLRSNASRRAPKQDYRDTWALGDTSATRWAANLASGPGGQQRAGAVALLVAAGELGGEEVGGAGVLEGVEPGADRRLVPADDHVRRPPGAL